MFAVFGIKRLGPPACAGPTQLEAFRKALADAAKASPLTSHASRLSRLTGAGKTHKTHTMFLLAGPIGYYAVAAAGLEPQIGAVCMDILQACGDLWDKAITRCAVLLEFVE